MTTTIKITELTNIGANLASSTVIPVVNMAGTPTTEKTVLGNIANVVLAGAGGNYVSAAKATTATTANTVLTNAQPNITSMGNLTGLTVSNVTGIVNFTTTANVTLGNVSNLHIAGGTAGQLLSTNGNGTLSWASDTTTYGNSNVVTLLSAFGSNTITTTGNVSVGNIIGNGQALTNIAGANVSGFVANANVSNTAFAVAGANVSGFVANANIANTAFSVAGANVSGFVANANVSNTAYAVAAANVSGLGNIATINLTGNSSNVLYGNGVFAAVAGGANTGNVTFNDVNIIGTGNLNLQPNSADAAAYVNIYLTGAADIHMAAGAAGANLILGTDEEANVAVLQGGNVAIQAGNVSGTKTWNFDTTGNLTLPLNSVVYETNIPDQSLSGSAIALKPTGGTTANQQLLIYPTANDGDHIHMTSGNLYTTELFLGSDNLYVKLANTGNVVINSNDGNSSNAMWTFGTDGSLTLPIGVSIDYNGNIQYPRIIADSGKLFSVQGQGNSGSAALAWTVDPDAASQYAAVAVSRAGDNLAKVVLQAQSDSGNVGTVKLWNFDETGNLTLPGNTVAINFANGSSAFGNIVATNLDGSSSNVLYGNGIFSAVPAPTVAQDITSTGAMSIMTYDGNLKYVNYATVEPSTGNIAGGNISASGNISANNFTGNGGGLSNVATKITSSWTLEPGVNTVNISVPLNGTYALWVNGNIPNGIVTYTATAVVTNTNVPVLGEQYGWYYAVGNALVLTSIPNQFTGTVGSISNVNTYLGNTANVFTFGITNNSGNTAVVNYGYTKL
jgi:hypothetical protein